MPYARSMRTIPHWSDGAAHAPTGPTAPVFDPSTGEVQAEVLLAGPADVALVGDEATVSASVRRLADVGVTDFAAAEFGGTADEIVRAHV